MSTTPVLYAYDANKLTSITATGGGTSKSYTYDNAGNCTSVTAGSTTTTLTWDAEERVKTVSGTSGGTFTYNGIGQRVRKVEGSSTFNYTRESDAIDAPVLDDGGASYTQAGGSLVSENRGGTVKYYNGDALGTTRSLTSSTQTVTDTFRFGAFGLNTGRTGTTATPFGFAGSYGYQADSSGLMLLGHRYYDASTGRFLSRDRIHDGYNGYAYGWQGGGPSCGCSDRT